MIRHYLFLNLLILTALSGCGRPDKIQETPVVLQRAESFMVQGVKKYQRYEYPAARTKFVLALHDYQSFNDIAGIVRSRLNLARVALNLGELEEAEKQLLLARNIIDGHQLSQLKQYADLMNSSLLIRQQKFTEAENLLSPYLVKNKDIGKDSALVLATVQNRTIIAIRQEKDMQYWVENYRNAVQHDPEKYRARLLRFEAELALQEENVSRAQELQEEALELYSRQSDPRGVAYTSLEKAAILENSSKHTEAILDYERALSAGFRIRDRHVVIIAVEGLIQLYGEMNKSIEQETLTKLRDDIMKADTKKPWYLLRPVD